MSGRTIETPEEMAERLYPDAPLATGRNAGIAVADHTVDRRAAAAVIRADRAAIVAALEAEACMQYDRDEMEKCCALRTFVAKLKEGGQ